MCWTTDWCLYLLILLVSNVVSRIMLWLLCRIHVSEMNINGPIIESLLCFRSRTNKWHGEENLGRKIRDSWYYCYANKTVNLMMLVIQWLLWRSSNFWQLIHIIAENWLLLPLAIVKWCIAFKFVELWPKLQCPLWISRTDVGLYYDTYSCHWDLIDHFLIYKIYPFFI